MTFHPTAVLGYLLDEVLKILVDARADMRPVRRAPEDRLGWRSAFRLPSPRPLPDHIITVELNDMPAASMYVAVHGYNWRGWNKSEMHWFAAYAFPIL
jgi:hypothetical protein